MKENIEITLRALAHESEPDVAKTLLAIAGEVKALNEAARVAEMVVTKVESGKMRSVETYSLAKKVLADLAALRTPKRPPMTAAEHNVFPKGGW